MQRITITIDDDLLTAVDELCEQRGYGSRSEAVRDIVRDAVWPAQAALAGDTPFNGALSYVYSHGTRDLRAARPTRRTTMVRPRRMKAPGTYPTA